MSATSILKCGTAGYLAHAELLGLLATEQGHARHVDRLARQVIEDMLSTARTAMPMSGCSTRCGCNMLARSG